MLNLSEEDQELFGFVSVAIGSAAVTNEEVRRWAVMEVERRDEPPVGLFDLLDFEGGMVTFIDTVEDGYPPSSRTSSGLSQGQYSALDGISYIRGLPRDFDGVSRKTALAALQRHPEVAERFREVFPFIEW